LDEYKDHCRLETADDDAYLFALHYAAVEWAESFTNRAFLTQTWDLKLDAFPAVIRPPRAPLQSVTSIGYTDANGDAQTMDAADYQVDATTEPGRIVPAYNTTWPTVRSVLHTITVRYVAGYGDTRKDVPEVLRIGLRLLVAHWYEHREPVVQGGGMVDVPLSFRSIFIPWRVWDFG
jgi:uncharacterized phiE125 gp8 family phage protein